MTGFGDLLPPLGPDVDVRPGGGPVALLDAARFRRRTRLRTAAATAAALTLLFGGYVVARPAPVRDRVVTLPEARAAAPSATSGGNPATTAPAPGPTMPGPVSPAPPAAGPAAPPIVVHPPWTAPPTPTSASPVDRITRVDREVVPFEADGKDQSCTTDVSVDGSHDGVVLCHEVETLTEVRSGRPITFSYRVCSPATDGILHFAGPPDVVGHIVNKGYGRPIWTITHRAAKGPHSVPIKAKSCLRYRIHFDGVDDSGRPLAPGVYEIRPQLAAFWMTTQPVTGTFVIATDPA